MGLSYGLPIGRKPLDYSTVFGGGLSIESQHEVDADIIHGFVRVAEGAHQLAST